MTSPPQAGSGFNVVRLASLSLVALPTSFGVLLGCLKKTVSGAVYPCDKLTLIDT
ncbi:hypothetical protein K443DRAFT_325985 [Laccaria amethystina LaAM-08-1]|uniref:Uncharacterized protein n=1 Tax=Laccaria amethystina LaAM-08-1 TaxID=1095629 RepID=A0A0C9XVZ5_9AGAR|nr:hypothetical protein K443DRAFT_325985 [Laccaria amethystina LaAM-08-1]